MDTEIPLSNLALPSSLTERWQNRHSSSFDYIRNHHRIKIRRYQNENRTRNARGGETKSNPSAVRQPRFGALPWLNNVQDHLTNHKENTFLSHWNYQLTYFQDHLTNVRVNEDDTPDHLMFVESPHPAEGKEPQRIYTISLQSDEYRDIRMTYLHANGAQVFRCACYPRNGDMPILGMGLMQFGGGVRNVAILDFHPLSKDAVQPFEFDALYDQKLQEIRTAHPLLQQDMSNKHYDPNEKQFYSAKPIIGKWSSDDTQNDAMWRQLQTAHQKCVQTHVGMTKKLSGLGTPNVSNDGVLALHASFDDFVSAREPASGLLAQAFGGKDISDRMIHQVIFPLSKRNQILRQQRQVGGLC